jgi:hypothetical protein
MRRGMTGMRNEQPHGGERLHPFEIAGAQMISVGFCAEQYSAAHGDDSQTWSAASQFYSILIPLTLNMLALVQHAGPLPVAALSHYHRPAA